MKPPILPLLMLCLASWAGGEEPLLKADKLTLKSGKAFTGVSVTEKRPDGISIMHADGTARIKFEDLPDDVVTKLGGFDPDAAKTARDAADRKEAAALEAIDKGLAELSEKDQARKDHKAALDASLPAVVRVSRVTPEGVLCNIAWYVDGKLEKTGKDAFGRNIVTYFKTAQLAEFSDVLHFVTGITDAVDGQRIECNLVGAGTHRYGVAGAENTVRKWRLVGATANTPKPAYTPKPSEPEIAADEPPAGGD